jgi:hypothetical protein
VAGGCPLSGHEKFAAPVAELTDPLALELPVWPELAPISVASPSIAALHIRQERHCCAQVPARLQLAKSESGFQQTNVGFTIMMRTRGFESVARGGRGGDRAGINDTMRYAERTSSPGSAGIWTVMALAMALSGCAGRWFETRPQGNASTAPANIPEDFKTSAVTYVRQLCALPREQRDTKLRELNEALLPNHAAISCGPSATPGE